MKRKQKQNSKSKKGKRAAKQARRSSVDRAKPVPPDAPRNFEPQFSQAVQVSLSDLRKHLGDYLDRVDAGDEVLICRRNRPVARITRIVTHRGVPSWANRRSH